MNEQETIYYLSEVLFVSNSRVIIGSKVYSLANITSVDSAKGERNSLLPIIFGLFGFSCAIIGWFENENVFLGIGIAIFISAILGFFLQKEKYFVRIRSASGESDSFKSTDEDQIDEIVTALNQAIVDRG